MITAILSKKGGVGKTTTSVNLAAALALDGQRVLVIDLDPNAGASLCLGLKKSELPPGAADVLLRNVSAREAIRPTRTPGLDVLPASVDLRNAEVDFSAFSRKETVLRDWLDQEGPEGTIAGYDHVFLDCPSSMGLLTHNAIVAADTFLVPSTPHFLALEGLEHLITTAERLSFNAGGAGRFLGIVLTAVDYRIRTTRTILERMRRRFGARTFAVEIRVNVSLAEAPAFGQTVFQYRPRSTGAQSYALLAEEFLMLATRARAEDHWLKDHALAS